MVVNTAYLFHTVAHKDFPAPNWNYSKCCSTTPHEYLTFFSFSNIDMLIP